MDSKKYKQHLLNQLYAQHKKELNQLKKTFGCIQIVFGHGNPDAKLVFIGEAPGRDEDKQGKPFVGRSGKLLNKLLEAIGTKRENVFITNIVKCRPPNNRTPLSSEINFCRQLLFQEIKIIRPKVIATLGSTALKGLLDQEIKISQKRGKPFKFNDITILPTYHPAYILRNPKELDTLAQDLQKAYQLSQKGK